MKFGDALRKYRKKRNLTQAQVANLLKVSPSVISKWEANERTPRHRLIVEKLQEMLGREIKEVYELGGGMVHLTEAVGGHRDLLDAWLATGLGLTDQYSGRLDVKFDPKEVVFRLKVR